MRARALTITAPIVIPLIIASGTGPEEPPDAQQQAPREVPVTLSLDSEGNPVADPDPVPVRPRDVILWQGDFEWEIRIPDARRPLGFAGQQGIRGRRGERRGGEVRPGAPQGRYQYDIIVITDDGMRVLDPEIEVGPG